MMTETDTDTRKLSNVVITLLKGVLYRDQQPAVWQTLMETQAPVIDYVKVLDLELIVDDGEGFAYLQQRPVADDETNPLPKLIQRRPLSYPVSLLCVLLRKKLVENDASGGEVRVILSREQIVEALRVFLPVQANEARIVEQIDTHINKVIELGFLRKLNAEPPAFEIRRIIQALVDADWLADLDEKLKTYREHADASA